MIIDIQTQGPVPHFSWVEIANNLSKDEIKLRIKDWEGFYEHCIMMEELRMWAVRTFPDVFPKGLKVSSWYREKNYNRSVGGASNSAHLDGRATDINNIPANLYDAFIIAWRVICSIHNKVGGIELYAWGMHFDNFSDKFGYKEFRVKDNRGVKA
jgi:hypothetical protein